MTDIANRVAVVTGGASGIGRGIAEQLLAEGARVAIADIDGARAEAVAAEIGAVGFRVDVADLASVQQLAQDVVAEFGGVDIVVNNAGVGPTGRIVDLTPDDWKWITDVNYFGVVNGVQAFLPLLRANPAGGHIVNTASMAIFLPLEGLAPYVASKMAVYGLSQVLAAELASDGIPVHVSVLPPGPVHTNIKESLKHRPAGHNGGLADVDLEEGEAADGLRWIDPIDAGRIVTRAIRNNDFLAITHPDWWPMVADGFAKVEADFTRYEAGVYEG
jgi:NAD(P)-dependent dehydrogenase (short-subunit alcohol dehydrogenase family)